MIELRHSLLMKFIKEKEMYTMARRKPEAITSRSITLVKLTGTLRLLRYVKVIFSSRQCRKNVVQVADMWTHCSITRANPAPERWKNITWLAGDVKRVEKCILRWALEICNLTFLTVFRIQKTDTHSHQKESKKLLMLICFRE